MGSPGPAVFEFGEFRLDAARRLLFRGDAPVPILPRAFDILLCLVQRRGQLVTKEELLKAVWPDTFVEEGNLAQNISVIRRALGESPRDHRYIVTIPRRGYRFAPEIVETRPAASASPRAVELCLKARQLLNRRLTESLLQAIALFVQASDEDPTYAPAWVGLADAYALLSLYGALAPGEAFPRSRAAAEQALALDPAKAEAHNALAVVELFYAWNWPAAESAFRRALELRSDYSDAEQRYGIFLIVMGRFDEARTALDRAQALDPLSRIIATIAGYPAYYSRQYEAAARQFRHVLQIDPDFSMAHFRLGLALTQLGQYDEALLELQTSKRLSNDRDVIAALGRLYALMGRRAEAKAALEELHARSRTTFVAAYAVALIHTALGDRDRAFEWLEKAVAERSYWAIYLNVDPALDDLRADPRFDALRARVGLAG
ncbi:MAG: tetratricopeptide repeat protein [Vicinamibacterales bacterium]